jgi:hypothetical protein
VTRWREHFSIVLAGLLLGAAGGFALHLAANDRAALAVASPAYAGERTPAPGTAPAAKGAASPAANPAAGTAAKATANPAVKPAAKPAASPASAAKGTASPAVKPAASPAATAASAPKMQAERDQIRRYEREPYYYAALGRRDPFTSLLEGEFMAEGQAGLVDVGNIKLVGIAWDEIDRFAMVEDGRGFGFVLREGDAIRGGKVLRIDRESVTFAQFTAGVSNTITIDLPTRESE